MNTAIQHVLGIGWLPYVSAVWPCLSRSAHTTTSSWSSEPNGNPQQGEHGKTQPLQVGSRHEMHKTFSLPHVEEFLRITGDENPLHRDAAIAAAAGFQGLVLPGILIASLFPAIIGSAYPGSLYVSQTVKFREAALIGEPLQAVVVVSKRSRQWVVFQTTCQSALSGTLFAEGEAMAKLPTP